jgi:hypothetical protein
MGKTVIGIDPGKEGAFVLLSDKKFESKVMPLKTDGGVDFEAVRDIIEMWQFDADHIFLERAVAFRMGCTSAFNYGRGFAALEIACMLSGLPVTYVEPAKWTRVIHAGIKKDLKPKQKSLIALERLHKPIKKLVLTSRNGKLHEGIVDALLIASFGLRHSP